LVKGKKNTTRKAFANSISFENLGKYIMFYILNLHQQGEHVLFCEKMME
jgi:hypothetical protein